MKERIAVIAGIRTPMGKAGGALKTVSADDLGAFALKALMDLTPIKAAEVDEVIFGNCAMPADAANIARVIALKAGFPIHTPAFTVQRNCASGMQSISSAMESLWLERASVMVAGGTESMSNIPLLYSEPMANFFNQLMKAKSPIQKLRALAGFRPWFLKPVIGVLQGLTDPMCGLLMGQTAEVLAREFKLSRLKQDEYALSSHQRASAATQAGRLAEEIIPIPLAPSYRTVVTTDEGPRFNQTMEALQKLKPYFEKNGTVTVGNSSQLTDGAAAVLLMRESTAKERGLTPLGFIRDYAYAGVEPSRMGLGPAYATARLFKQTGMTMSQIDLIEMNEAFAAVILANMAAFASDAFSQEFLDMPKALGTIDPEKLNVNGGAVALGHPTGMTGTRLVITLLKEMHRRNLHTGLATLCVGGGQGAAFLVETH